MESDRESNSHEFQLTDGAIIGRQPRECSAAGACLCAVPGDHSVVRAVTVESRCVTRVFDDELTYNDVAWLASALQHQTSDTVRRWHRHCSTTDTTVESMRSTPHSNEVGNTIYVFIIIERHDPDATSTDLCDCLHLETWKNYDAQRRYERLLCVSFSVRFHCSRTLQIAITGGSVV